MLFLNNCTSVFTVAVVLHQPLWYCKNIVIIMISIVNSMIVISVCKYCYYYHNQCTYCHYLRHVWLCFLDLFNSVLGFKALLEDLCEMLKGLCLWSRKVDQIPGLICQALRQQAVHYFGLPTQVLFYNSKYKNRRSLKLAALCGRKRPFRPCSWAQKIDKFIFLSHIQFERQCTRNIASAEGLHGKCRTLAGFALYGCFTADCDVFIKLLVMLIFVLNGFEFRHTSIETRFV